MDHLDEAMSLLYLGEGREGPEDARAARELAQIHVLMSIADSLSILAEKAESLAATTDGELIIRAFTTDVGRR